MTFVIRKLNTHEKVGDQLKAMRLELNQTLPEMAKKTSIRRSYLEALEKGIFEKLPEPLYTKNLLRTYVRALGGDEEYILKRFEEERGTCDFTSASRLPRRRARSMAFLSPARLIKFTGIALICFAVVGYLGLQLRTITSPPRLSVSAPDDGYTTNEAIVNIAGKTDPHATVQVNGREVLLGQDGSFETEVALERGLNVITVEGAKRYSRPTVLYRRVILKQDRETALSRDGGG